MNARFPSPCSDIEAQLQTLRLRDADAALAASLERDLADAFHARRRRRVAALACAACLTIAAASLLLHPFPASPAAAGSEMTTETQLVRARFTGRQSEGARYEALFERRFVLPESRRCRIVVSVPEERTVIIPDEPI